MAVQFFEVEKGRSIYSGIQKFVAFIMSVHIAEVGCRVAKCAHSAASFLQAEVMQIFLCIVVGIPVHLHVLANMSPPAHAT